MWYREEYGPWKNKTFTFSFLFFSPCGLLRIQCLRLKNPKYSGLNFVREIYFLHKRGHEVGSAGLIWQRHSHCVWTHYLFHQPCECISFLRSLPILGWQLELQPLCLSYRPEGRWIVKKEKNGPLLSDSAFFKQSPTNTFALISLFRIQSYGHTGWELWSFVLDNSITRQWFLLLRKGEWILGKYPAACETPSLVSTSFPTGLLHWFYQNILDWKFIFLKIFIYLGGPEMEGKGESGSMSGGGAEGKGEADSPLSWEPNAGAPSQDPGIMTWAEGRCLTDWATQVPWTENLNNRHRWGEGLKKSRMGIWGALIAYGESNTKSKLWRAQVIIAVVFL